MSERYTLVVREDGQRVSERTMPDPFHHTTITTKDSLWRALLRRERTFSVVVSADSATVEAVLELDDDYKGAPGSLRRAEFEAVLAMQLETFAAGATDE